MGFTDSSIGVTGENFSKAADGPTTNSSTLCDIVQSVGEQQRIGRKVTIRNIYLRLIFEWINSATSNLLAGTLGHETIRVLLFIDKQTNGSAVIGTDLLEADNFLSFRNMANTGRFRVLHDKQYVFNTTAIAAGNGTANDSQLVHKEYIIKISKKVYIPIEFDGATGAITEIRTNNIGLMVWAAHGGRIKLFGTAKSVGRLRYTDY